VLFRAQPLQRQFPLFRPENFCCYLAVAKASLAKIVTYCDRLLRTSDTDDFEGAFNGLQVENPGTVRRVAAAVDASLATIQLAANATVDLLVVHHGLFWNRSHPWCGKQYELLRLLLDNQLAVYSSHLPLDAHPKLGNNVQLCAALGLARLEPFFFSHGRFIGFKSKLKIERKKLAQRLQRLTGHTLVIPGGPDVCNRIGVVSGGAGAELRQAAREGVDTFITGEGPHWTYALAEEVGVNVLYAGHYATETFGVKALAAHISRRFQVPWLFLDHPTGL
jgi:dinuclear metal center YbgI/SA1388 family protein